MDTRAEKLARLWEPHVAHLLEYLSQRAHEPVLAAERSPEGRLKIVWANHAAGKQAGRPEADLEGVSLFSLLTEETHPRIIEELREQVRSGVFGRSEIVLSSPDARSRMLQLTLDPVDAEANLWLCYLRDEQPRIEAQRALLLEQERFSGLLRTMDEGALFVDAEGAVQRLNRRAEQITGWRESEARGKPGREIFPLCYEDDEECDDEPLQRVIKTGVADGESEQMVLITRSGQHKRLRLRTAPIFGPRSDVVGAVAVFDDISQRVPGEKELIKSQRLESISLLAGGVAHDFNNILTGILGNISLARQCAGYEKRLDSILKSAEKAANRARDLTQQLLSFAQGSAPSKSRVALEELIQECARFMLSGSNCTFTFAATDDLWVAEVDPGQISQVFQNLMINAIQAMPEGGEITIAAENQRCETEDSLPLSGGNYVKITISDQGTGIDPGHLGRIFDPYFTTKETGNGLGLATVFSIVRRHEGCIDVESTPGKGATFTLFLPAIPGARRTRKSVEARIAKGRGRVLVMDDEAMVQQIAGDMLTHLGYEVGFADNGQQALEKYQLARDTGLPYDIVLVDLTVPGGAGGLKCLQLIREVDPQARIVVSSGYSNDPVILRAKDYGFNGSVLKPYNIQQLSWALKEALKK
ncbi:MAG: ATP-binding protein [Verrucomicrobiota bacterium]